jgi:hypothetical protein
MAMFAEEGAEVSLAGARALLADLSGAIKDLSPVFRGPIDETTTRAFEAQFATKGTRLNGAPWQPLSPTTIALRTRVVTRKDKSTGLKTRRSTNRVGQARAGFATPLQNTRRLWASFVKSGGPEGVRVITPSTYQRGSRLRYAAGHQTGFLMTSMFGRPLKTPKRVPARPMVPSVLPADLVNEYERAMARYIVDGAL